MTCMTCAMLWAVVLPGAIAEVQPWWTDNTAAWVGSIGGSAIGGCGALIGVLAGLGKGRRFVLPMMATLIVLGAAGAIAGVVALWCGQPYGVWYPLLLGGCLVAGITAGVYPTTRQRYRELELRKIQAADS